MFGTDTDLARQHKTAYVTDGRCERSVHFTAGIALCQAAGVVITDFDGEAVHTGAGIIAARDAGSHATLMELVARYRSGS